MFAVVVMSVLPVRFDHNHLGGYTIDRLRKTLYHATASV